MVPQAAKWLANKYLLYVKDHYVDFTAVRACLRLTQDRRGQILMALLAASITMMELTYALLTAYMLRWTYVGHAHHRAFVFMGKCRHERHFEQEKPQGACIIQCLESHA